MTPPRAQFRPEKGGVGGSHGASCFGTRIAAQIRSKQRRQKPPFGYLLDKWTKTPMHYGVILTSILLIIKVVAPSGIEPELSALRGRRVNQLHHGAVRPT